jgi:hypothetical protein
MSGPTKALIAIGGIAAAGIAGWWYYNKQQTEAQTLQDQVLSDVVPTATGGYVVVPGGGTPEPTPTPTPTPTPNQPEGAQVSPGRPTQGSKNLGGETLTWFPGFPGSLRTKGQPPGKITYDTGTMNWTVTAFMAGIGRASAASEDLLIYGPDAAALAGALAGPGPPTIPFAVTPYPYKGMTGQVAPAYPVSVPGYFKTKDVIATSSAIYPGLSGTTYK